MSKGSAVISILIAFVVGLAVGHLTGGGGGEELAEAGDEGVERGAAMPAGDGSDAERFRIEVTPDQPSRGPADALVTIVMFSDYQCPFCSRVEPTIKQLMDEYRGKLRVVWRDNPLPFHDKAMPAAELAREAFAQGGNDKFWRAHDLLFEHQRELDRPQLDQYAQQLGLDMNRYRQAMDNHTHQGKIQADQALARSVEANGTPAFFINGKSLSGAQPIDRFKEVINAEIAHAESILKRGVAKNRLYAEIVKNGKTKGAAGARPDQQKQPRRQPDPNAVYKVPVTADNPSRGPADALVTIVMFSDYQCPFCSRVEPTVKQILDTYGNDVRVVWRDNPLPFHDKALPAAILAREAFAQGGAAKFWAAHDLLFEHQRELDRPQLEQYAQQLGLNMGRVRSALDQQTHKDKIDADQALARSLGASGTPAFFINGRNLRGAQPFESFKRVIDEELAKARQKVQSGTPRARVYEETIRNGATEPVFLPGAPGGGGPEAAPPGEDPNRVYNIPVPQNAPSKGAANARVTIQIFSDFQCPFCSRVEPTLAQLAEQYGNRVRFVWRNYPLPFHDNAMPAAEAAMEAFAQGGNEKFWAMHAKLFENQRALTRPDLERYAQELGLNMTRFRQALDNHTHKASVEADMAAVQRAGAQIGTPSFFINGKLLQGAQPVDAFKAAIDGALAAPAPAR